MMGPATYLEVYFTFLLSSSKSTGAASPYNNTLALLDQDKGVTLVNELWLSP